jgi:hypothetical protein
MSDVQDQVERVLEKADVPADISDESPDEADIHPDRTRETTHSSFSRMRRGWKGDDRDTVLELEAMAQDIIRKRFAVAFAVHERIKRLVRKQALDEVTGAYVTYPDGTPVWVKDELGAPVEEWDLMNDRERGSLLDTITQNMFEWELTAASIWAEAMYAKGIWQEVFARGFTAMPGQQVTGKPTVQDREQWGNKNAAEERYFSLFQSSLSRRAEAVLKGMRAMEYRLGRSLDR